MIVPVVLATCIFLHVGIADKVTTNNTLSPKILGGHEIRNDETNEEMFILHKYPFLVTLRQYPSELVTGLELEPRYSTQLTKDIIRDADTYPRCLGSIIDPRWVVTIARCLQVKNGNTISVRNVEHSIDLEDTLDWVEAVYLHPDFDGYDNDIGLLHLKRSITIGRPINIGNIKGDVNTSLLFVGWGAVQMERVDLGILLMRPKGERELDVFTTPCTPGLLDRSDLMESILCTSTTDGRGACTEDEGGPLLTVQHKTLTLIGFLSRFVPCATGAPDTFINVSYYNKWIVDTVRKNYMG